MNTLPGRFRRGDSSPKRPGLVFEGYHAGSERWITPERLVEIRASKQTPEYKAWLKAYHKTRRGDEASRKLDAATARKRELNSLALITTDFHRGDSHPNDPNLVFWKYKHGKEKWVSADELQAMRSKANDESVKRYASKNTDPEHRASRQSKQRIYCAKNRKRINAWYVRNRAENPNAKLAARIRSCIRDATLRQNAHKASRSVELLGCSIPEFRDHLERQFTEGMSWKLFACGDIQIDHKIAIASYDLKEPEQQKMAFNFRNCSPMWAEENRRKLDKMTINGKTVLGRHLRKQNIIPFQAAA